MNGQNITIQESLSKTSSTSPSSSSADLLNDFVLVFTVAAFLLEREDRFSGTCDGQLDDPTDGQTDDQSDHPTYEAGGEEDDELQQMVQRMLKRGLKRC